MPKLSPPSDGRAEQVRLAEQAPLLLLGHPAGHVHALGVEQQRLHLLGGDSGDRQARGHARVAQRLEAPQQHRKPLAALGTAEEEDLEVLAGRGRRPGGGEVDPVGHDPVAAAVEAAGGPGRGLGHGDPGAELAVEAARADQVRGDVVDRAVRGVGVEGPDGRHRARLDGEPAHHRHVRLVHVDHVVAAAAQLLREQRHRASRDGEVRHRAVHRQADRAPERDPVVGEGPLLRRDAAVGHASQTVVGVVRGQAAGPRGPAGSAPQREPQHDAQPRPDTCTNRARPALHAPADRSVRSRRSANPPNLLQ